MYILTSVYLEVLGMCMRVCFWRYSMELWRCGWI